LFSKTAIACGLFFFPILNVTFAASEVSPQKNDDPHLSLVWHDGYNLAPKVYGIMKREVESIFSEIGIDATVRRGEVGRYFRRETSYPEVNVVLHPNESVEFGFDEDAMGAAFGNYAYIFLSKIKEALAQDKGESSDKLRALNQLGQALGRVVAHEVVHLIAPGRPHAAEGLMCGSLTRLDLTRRHIQMDSESVEAIRARLLDKKAPRAVAAPAVVEASTTIDDEKWPKPQLHQ
jgi:hypothetical protein